jgi:hypothetical protein
MDMIEEIIYMGEDDYCIICYDVIYDYHIYAKIDHPDENYKKYHPDCLLKWFETHNTGILSQNIIPSYSIFSHDCKIDTIAIKQEYVSNNTNNTHNTHGTHGTNGTNSTNNVIITEIHNDDDNTNDNRSSWAYFLTNLLCGLSLLLLIYELYNSFN